MTNSRKKGALCEDTAARFLEKLGYRIISRNYTVRGGEIDITALDGETLVFVEVKGRKNDRFGRAAEAVGKNKISHIVTAAERFIYENPELSGKAVRFDVIEVYTQKNTVNHIKSIDIN